MYYFSETKSIPIHRYLYFAKFLILKHLEYLESVNPYKLWYDRLQGDSKVIAQTLIWYRTLGPGTFGPVIYCITYGHKWRVEIWTQGGYLSLFYFKNSLYQRVHSVHIIVTSIEQGHEEASSGASQLRSHKNSIITQRTKKTVLKFPVWV